MVAYSFKSRFITPIRAGSKQQTIRAPRKRHAYPGEEVQLYTGMRTSACKLIGTAHCLDVVPIRLDFGAGLVSISDSLYAHPSHLEAIAQRDGFLTWSEMAAFWSPLKAFEGVLVRWADFEGANDGV